MDIGVQPFLGLFVIGFVGTPSIAWGYYCLILSGLLNAFKALTRIAVSVTHGK